MDPNALLVAMRGAPIWILREKLKQEWVDTGPLTWLEVTAKHEISRGLNIQTQFSHLRFDVWPTKLKTEVIGVCADHLIWGIQIQERAEADPGVWVWNWFDEEKRTFNEALHRAVALSEEGRRGSPPRVFQVSLKHLGPLTAAMVFPDPKPARTRYERVG